MNAARMPDEKMTQWVEAHQTALLRLCFAYLHDRGLAEDAVQETFLKAYRGYHRFRREASEKTWLSRIAINTCRDFQKSARRRRDGVSLDTLPEPVEATSGEDRLLTLSVMELPVALRECVLLYYFEDMTCGEIARTLHISQQAVSKRLKTAREELRAKLEGREEDE